MNDALEKNMDEIVLKLLHYFITEQGYNPIVLHGAQNEIWLEKMNSNYKIIRIVTNYIHNDEQFNFDIFKTKQIIKKIKRKTFSLNMNALSIFLNLGDNVHMEESIKNIRCIDLKDINDLNKYEFVVNQFPTITKKTDFKEKGVQLFMKITKDLNDRNTMEANNVEEVFKLKRPIITYLIILINAILFVSMYIFGNGSEDASTLLKFGANFRGAIEAGEYYRLLACSFLHIGILHFLFNNYALYIIGPQLESYFGKIKYAIIYVFSAVTASLMSILFTDAISAGASGAIFGLLGALLYFGYHYRVYLGSVLKSQIIPLILINLLFGFSMVGIDNAAHIGGLIGGVLISIALGVKYKSTDFERVNGWIMSSIYIGFLILMIIKMV